MKRTIVSLTAMFAVLSIGESALAVQTGSNSINGIDPSLLGNYTSIVNQQSTNTGVSGGSAPIALPNFSFPSFSMPQLPAAGTQGPSLGSIPKAPSAPVAAPTSLPKFDFSQFSSLFSWM